MKYFISKAFDPLIPANIEPTTGPTTQGYGPGPVVVFRLPTMREVQAYCYENAMECFRIK